MAFGQQIGFGGIPSIGWSPMQMFGGTGQNFLMGNATMGTGGSFGMNMGGDAFSMQQLLNQFLSQNSGQAGQGTQFSSWQQQMPSQEKLGFTADGRALFNPDANQSPYDQLQALKAYANANGSQDGTPFAEWSTRQQDMGSAQFAGQLASKQATVVGQAIEAASPEEQKLLKETEATLAAQFQKSADEGKPVSQQQRDLATSTAIDNLYKDGRIKAGVGDANRQYLEMNKYQAQTEANLFLKWGLPLPDGTSAEAVAASPYNTANRK